LRFVVWRDEELAFSHDEKSEEKQIGYSDFTENT
jgi:hypothetical protein